MAVAVALICALALTLLAGPARSAEPEIVLRLPATMTPEQVKALVEELQAKGAVAEQPPKPEEKRVEVGSDLATIGAGAIAALRAAPRLLTLPALWQAGLAAEGGGPATGFFWLGLLALVLAAWLVEGTIHRVFRLALDRRCAGGNAPLVTAIAVNALRLFAGLGAFILVLRLGSVLLPRTPALLAETAEHVAALAIQWRISVDVLAVLLAPGRAAARPLHLDNASAALCYRWLWGYLTFAPFFFFAAWLSERVGAGHDAVFAVGLILGAIITAYKIVMFLTLRRPIADAILTTGGGIPGLARRMAAALWHWLFILLALAVFFLAMEEFTFGRGAQTTVNAAALQAVIVAMALAWGAKQHLLARRHAHGKSERWWAVAVGGTVNAAVLLGGLAWVAYLWGQDIFAPPPGSFAAKSLRPWFEAALTIAISAILWCGISALLQERMPKVLAPGDEDAEASDHVASRLSTMVPLLKHSLAVLIGFLGAMTALSHLGFDIGPLLAGAGVVGIAVGFGAQSLVRDVISGVFFLFEDAFRVGEYIDTGRLKGTVEGISLRSLRLRHQSGQVHTVPFGQILAVTNSSRDWSVVRFNLHIEPAADLELVRKTVKRLGLELLEDPEVGSEFIQPLKLQGVLDVTRDSMVIRCKFTARPARPSFVQRQALRRIIQRFGEAGIRFAMPPVAA